MGAMAEIINLNRARKARDKAEAERTAEANRVLHGRSKSERQATEKTNERRDRDLDGHKLDD